MKDFSQFPVYHTTLTVVISRVAAVDIDCCVRRIYLDVGSEDRFRGFVVVLLHRDGNFVRRCHVLSVRHSQFEPTSFREGTRFR